MEGACLALKTEEIRLEREDFEAVLADMPATDAPRRSASLSVQWAAGFGPEFPALRSVGYLEMGRFLRGEMEREAAELAFVRARQCECQHREEQQRH